MPLMSTVTVVITCYNQIETLGHALNALAVQSTRPYEVVIADDSSTQPIEDFARRNGCRFVTTRPHTSLRGSRSLARQLGLALARGEVVLHMDGDMIPSQRAIEFIMYDRIQSGRNNILQCSRRFRIRSGRILRGVAPPVNSNELTPAYHHFTSDCFAVDRQLATQVGGWDPNFVGWGEEDVEFAYRCQVVGGARIRTPQHADFYASHLDHFIDHPANFLSLTRNAEYFATKHPAVVAQRWRLWTDMGVYLTSYKRKWWLPWSASEGLEARACVSAHTQGSEGAGQNVDTNVRLFSWSSCRLNALPPGSNASCARQSCSVRPRP